MNLQTGSPIYNPDDPFFKQLRQRYYRLGSPRRRKILEELVAVPMKVSLGKEAERKFLFQIAAEGKIIDFLHGIETAEVDAKNDREGPERPPD